MHFPLEAAKPQAVEILEPALPSPGGPTPHPPPP